MARKLRIAIDCRIADPKQGIGTAVLALAKAFSDSGSADQEYTFIVREDIKDWLAPYIYGPCKLHGIPESRLSVTRAALRKIVPLRFLWKTLFAGAAPIHLSDGYVESHQFDLVHFPTQTAYLTELPTIYQPWDLQHVHYPHFFSQAEYSHRELLYRTFCDRATYVCVQAEWTKRDVMKQYDIAGEKIEVIPWGPVFDAYKSPSEEDIQAATKKFGFPSSFLFYPAIFWPHKNHEVILRALSILKSKHGMTPSVFFTGSSKDGRQALDKLARDFAVSEQLHFPGFVTPLELQAIYRAATAMVFPSRFEGFGLPILEAFHAGLPVLASSASTLPEVACDGALYFDPDSPSQLATLIKAILDKPELRRDLIAKGRLVLSQYSIGKMAASFQSLYERTAASPSPDHRLSPASTSSR